MCNTDAKNGQTLDIKITDENVMDVVSKDIDPQGRKLLSFLDSPKTPLDISYALKVPTTTLYRKLNQLNQDGFITQVGTKKTKNSKSNLYVKTFDRIILEVGRQNSVIITVKQSVLQNSVTYSTISK